MSYDPDPLLLEIWYLMESRIAPQLCCRYPPPVINLFREALREVAPAGGDLKKAIELLNILVRNADPGSMEFQQAGELLNIIEWRRKYHPAWTGPGRIRSIHPGRSGAEVAHAMAFMQSAFDEDALKLTEMIIAQGEPASDDIRMARLVRAGIYICTGLIDEGEDELKLCVSARTADGDPEIQEDEEEKRDN